MKTVIVHLRGVSPMSHSRMHDTPKLEQERPDNYERRTWREKLHYDENGEIFIPPMALKQALTEAAKMLNMQIPGRGKANFTKHFESGVLCVEPVLIGIKKDDIEGEWINAHANGIRGSGKRVKRCFPHIPAGWTGVATFMIFDETVTPEVFEEHILAAGRLIGIGRFRPRQGGYYGRFAIDKIEFIEGAPLAQTMKAAA